MSDKSNSAPSWLGLLKWSLAYQDGTIDKHLTPMQEEDKEWLKNALKDLVRDDATRMKELVTKVKKILSEKYLSEEDGEQLLIDFEDLREIIEQYDNSIDFSKLNGINLLFDLAIIDFSDEIYSYDKYLIKRKTEEEELEKKRIEEEKKKLTNQSEQLLDNNNSSLYTLPPLNSSKQISSSLMKEISQEIFSILGFVVQNSPVLQDKLNQEKYMKKIFFNLFTNKYLKDKSNINILNKFFFFIFSYIRSNAVEENNFFALNYYHYFLLNLVLNHSKTLSSNNSSTSSLFSSTSLPSTSLFFIKRFLIFLNYLIQSDFLIEKNLSNMITSYSDCLIKFLSDLLFTNRRLLDDFSTYFQYFEDDYYSETTTSSSSSASVRLTNPKIYSCLFNLRIEVGDKDEEISSFGKHELTVAILNLLISISSTTLGFEKLSQYNFLEPLVEKIKELNNIKNELSQKDRSEDEEDELEYKSEEIKLMIQLSMNLKKLNLKYPSEAAKSYELKQKEAIENLLEEKKNEEVEDEKKEILLLENTKPEAASNIP